MNKKTIFILVTAVVIIIILVLLGIKSCNPRVKPDALNTTDSTALTADQAKNVTERMDFINANVEFTCELIKNPDLRNDKAATEAGVRATFKKHNLPVDDNASMIALLKRYENDTDIATIVKANAKPCTEGKDPIYLQ
jgi:hypothetical protein